jgi:hypothetical protein
MRKKYVPKDDNGNPFLKRIKLCWKLGQEWGIFLLIMLKIM